MTGPEHYREAERVRAAALNYHVADEQGFSGWQRAELLALAQVHASLAQAAAAAAAQVDRWLGDESREGRAWTEAVL